MGKALFVAPVVVGEHAGKSPVLLLDFLDDDVDAFRLLAQVSNQRIGEFLDDRLLLGSGGGLRDLRIDVWHGWENKKAAPSLGRPIEWENSTINQYENQEQPRLSPQLRHL